MMRVYLMDIGGLESADACAGALELIDPDRRKQLEGRTGKPAALSLAAGMLIQCAYLDYSKEGAGEKEILFYSKDAIECTSVLKAAGHVENVCKSSDGRPYFPEHPDVFFSVSHSGGYAACSCSDVPNGIDIQEHRELSCDISGRYFAGEEDEYLKNESSNVTMDFFDLWCLHEAYMKYTGLGMKQGMKDVSFLPVLKADNMKACIKTDEAKKICAQILQAPAGYSLGVVSGL